MIKLKTKISDNSVALAKGLMGVKHMADDEGMLFKFPTSLEASFWGKDTYIPLDIAFVDKNNNIISIKEISPMSTRSIRSDGNCIMAIEANRGFFKNNNIHIGHKISIVSTNENCAEIEFSN